MQIISISSDKKIFEANNSTRMRMIEYGQLFDELHVIVFTPRSLSVVSEKISDNVWVYATKSRTRLGYIVDAVLMGSSLIKQRDRENIIVTSQDPFETGFVALLLKYFYKVRFQCQVHIDFFSRYYARESVKECIQNFIGPFILKRAHSIRVVSNKIKTYLVTSLHIAPNKISVLPIYTNAGTLLNSELKIDLRKKYPQFSHVILMASRLVKQKGITIGIDAFQDILEKFPRAGLIIVGSGPEERFLKAYVFKKKLNAHVFFEAWSNDISSYMKTCDIFILPSLYEGWGLTAVEAASCGIPVIMTDVGCAGEFIIDGVNGLVVPVGDSNALAQKMLFVLSNTAFRELLRHQARASITGLIDAPSYFHKYKEVMERAMI